MNDNLNLKLVINGEDKTGGILGKTRAGVQSISEQLQVMQNRLTGFLSLKVGEIIGNQIGKVIGVADSYKTLEARLKLVSDSTAEFVTAQQAVFEIAQRTRASLEGTANVYGKLETAVKQLGGTQKEALSVTETLNQAIALTSQGAAQDEAAILQFSQALGSGVLRGDEFNSVMENSPGLAKALADGLGVPIGTLRKMAEEGELTADRIIAALGKAAPQVAKDFAQLPLTVGQAFAVLSNAFTKYLGEADKASGATGTLAQAIKFAGENFKPLADTALTIAGIYGVTLLQGLVKSSEAYIANVAAAREKAIADQTAKVAALELLQTELEMARVRVITTKQLIEEARLQQALAVTDKERAASIKLVEKAFLDYHNAVNLANSKQAALAAATTQTAAATTLLQRAVSALNAALNLFIAFEISKTIGEWLNQFDLVKSAGVRLAEVFTIIKTGAEGMFSGISFVDRIEQIKKIHAEYNELAANIGKATTEQGKNTEAGKTAATQMQIQASNAAALAKSYKALADAAKDSADQQLKAIDAQTKQNVRKINTDQADSGGVDRSGAREAATTRATLEAERRRGEVIKKSVQERIELIDRAHDEEVTAAKKSGQSTADIDQKWLESKAKVLEEWQGDASKTVDQLIALEEKHRDAAAKIDDEIARHKNDTQAKANDIRIGAKPVEDYGDIVSLQGDAALKYKGNINNALKKGDTAAALREAKQYEDALSKIADKAKEAFDAGFIDEGQLSSAIYDMEKAAKQVDDINQQQADEQKKAGEEVSAEIEKQQKTVAEVSSQIDDVHAKLKDALVVKTDTTEVDAAIAKINEIPTEKVVTIKTVTDSGSTATSTGTQSTPGYATGARLAGFGGGDILPAMLEPGEGVVNKHAMRALDAVFGPQFFDGLNAGASPVELLRRNLHTLKFSTGGRVQVNLPNMDFSSVGGNGGTPINIHLPGGQSFGPFSGSKDTAAELQAALAREVLKRGVRNV